MAGFLFRLETPEGAPAEPSQLSSAVPNWAAGETIHFGRKTGGWLPCVTTMPTSLRYWSSRTRPNEPLTLRADVS